jgi:hypothetical protein
MRLRKQPDLIIGYVKVSAGVITGIAGTGFTVSRASAGNYDVKLPPGYRVVAAFGDALASIPGIGFGGPSNPNRVTQWITNTGAGLDGSFTFVAARTS